MPIFSRLLTPRDHRQSSWLISLALLGLLLLIWHVATAKPAFNPAGMSEEQLMLLEFKGDIVRAENGGYIYNPEKSRGIPGPWEVMLKFRDELSEAFVKKGTNDHGIGFLIRYTVTRFAAGFLSASVVAIFIGI